MKVKLIKGPMAEQSLKKCYDLIVKFYRKEQAEDKK